jgi:hypothetical protein
MNTEANRALWSSTMSLHRYIEGGEATRQHGGREAAKQGGAGSARERERARRRCGGAAAGHEVGGGDARERRLPHGARRRRRSTEVALRAVALPAEQRAARRRGHGTAGGSGVGRERGERVHLCQRLAAAATRGEAAGGRPLGLHHRTQAWWRLIGVRERRGRWRRVPRLSLPLPLVRRLHEAWCVIGGGGSSGCGGGGG